MFPLLQAVVALALLIGLPFVTEPPESGRELLIASACGLLLTMIAIRGFIMKLRDHTPRPFEDSVLVEYSPDDQMPTVMPEEGMPPSATKKD